MSGFLLSNLCVGISVIISIFICVGIITNTTNILVFWRLGMSSVSNLSLLVLSTVDLINVLLMTGTAIVLSPPIARWTSVKESAILWLSCPLIYSTIAISSWVTVVINMERCCCVVFPMKVKQIFTRKVVTSLFFGMVLYQLAISVPHYSLMGLTPVTSTTTNETLLAFDFLKYNNNLGLVFVFASSTAPTAISFVLVIIGTTFLLVKLRQSAEFHSSMTGNRRIRISTREKKVARSAFGICVIYIVCFSPTVGIYVATAIFPRFDVPDPVYGNAATFILYLSMLLQVVSASINFFVYLEMLSQFKGTLKNLFLRRHN
ncbi:peptide receptor GPCR [Elysia marginata]|uniref:Peptide receptor GPCR n=1 Tax=Elysia marginata TaxID=1093978 RepID=A0AAV4I3U2_9GAST|nr:peptide receptor GPCR [Elysia marginata]